MRVIAVAPVVRARLLLLVPVPVPVKDASVESRADRRRLELEKEAAEDDCAECWELISGLMSRDLMHPALALATAGKALEEVSAAETGGLVRGTEGAALTMDWGGEGWYDLSSSSIRLHIRSPRG
jgi:hypothetical protein